MAIAFPSLDFFQVLEHEVAAECERSSRLGFFDTTFGVRLARDGGSVAFTLAFEVFDCIRVADGIEPGTAAGPGNRRSRSRLTAIAASLAA